MYERWKNPSYFKTGASACMNEKVGKEAKSSLSVKRWVLMQ